MRSIGGKETAMSNRLGSERICKELAQAGKGTASDTAFSEPLTLLVL